MFGSFTEPFKCNTHTRTLI